MKNTYPVSPEHIARFVEINEKMREHTIYAEAQFYFNYKDLSLMQLQVLRIIGFHKSCTMSKIAEITHLTLGSITQIIDKLVTKKYVKRVPSKADRRVIYAELTAKGNKVIHASQGYVHTLAQDLMSKFTADEQKQFLEFFQRMTE